MASPRHDDKIAPTAHYTAYAWHRLRLPHAELFTTPLGRVLYWGFRLTVEGLPAWITRVPTLVTHLELRHRLFEAAVEDERPDVVVELGAGLSRRGLTWAERGTRYVEVDLPAMIEQKRQLIAERASPALRERIGDRLTHVAADVLEEGFEEHLRALLADAERPLVLAEGVLVYFAPEDRLRLSRTVARALGERGAFVVDLRAKLPDRSMSMALSLLRASVRVITSGRGAREELESEDAIRDLLLDAGFSTASRLPAERIPHLAGVRSYGCVFVARG